MPQSRARASIYDRGTSSHGKMSRDWILGFPFLVLVLLIVPYLLAVFDSRVRSSAHSLHDAFFPFSYLILYLRSYIYKSRYTFFFEVAPSTPGQWRICGPIVRFSMGRQCNHWRTKRAINS